MGHPPSGFQYDAAGNMVSDGVNSYLYDADGKLLSNTSLGTLYSYDSFGRLSMTRDGSGAMQSLIYGVNNRRVAIIDNSGLTAEYQIFAGSQPLAFAVNNQLTYQYQNQVGSEGARLKNGSLTTFASLPFGDTQAAGGAALDQDTNHFAGLDTLAVSPATMHATMRDYHPVAGRWLSPDPYDGSYSVRNPQTLNRYVYVGNNPLAALDPSGLKSVCYSDREYDPDMGWVGSGFTYCVDDPEFNTDETSDDGGDSGGGGQAPSKGCPANQRRFFANLPLYQGIAKQANTNVNFIMALSAQESGWNGPHSQELNNLFGTTHAGGRNLGYASYQASATAWANSYSSWVKGATTINQFVGDLLNHVPPYNVNAYGDYATSILGGTFKNPALNGASTIGTYQSVLNYASACGVNP